MRRADAVAPPQLKADLVTGAFGLQRAALSTQMPWGAQDAGSLLFDGVEELAAGRVVRAELRSRAVSSNPSPGFIWQSPEPVEGQLVMIL